MASEDGFDPASVWPLQEEAPPHKYGKKGPGPPFRADPEDPAQASLCFSLSFWKWGHLAEGRAQKDLQLEDAVRRSFVQVFTLINACLNLCMYKPNFIHTQIECVLAYEHMCIHIYVCTYICIYTALGAQKKATG